MPELVPTIDTSKPAGEQLSPEMRAEVAAVAPSAVLNNSITTAKMADNAVTEPKINAGAVTSPKIATGGVETVNLADGAATTPKIADNAVTAAKAGVGVCTAVDADDEPIENVFKFMTEAEYAEILAPDPNVTYLLRP